MTSTELPSTTSHVFVSHRGVDKPRLRNFVLRLADRRVPVWVDSVERFNIDLAPDQPRVEAAMLQGGIRKGADWPLEIDIALLSASVIVLFWSKAWFGASAVLAREHGVALARHRTGEAAYVPVFLDSEPELPEEVRRYRVESGDMVQGFDVAKSGHDNWNALLDSVDRLWHERSAAAASRGTGADPAVWTALASPLRTTEQSIALLKGWPEGPAVDRFLVTTAMVAAYAKGTTTITAPQLVASASALVLKALAYDPPNPYAFVIGAHELPVPDRGLSNYWSHAFDQACVLGPRMLGAFLLAAPTPILSGVRSDVMTLVEALESM